MHEANRLAAGAVAPSGGDAVQQGRETRETLVRLLSI
jgi:hypothetical protein